MKDRSDRDGGDTVYEILGEGHDGCSFEPLVKSNKALDQQSVSLV